MNIYEFFEVHLLYLLFIYTKRVKHLYSLVQIIYLFRADDFPILMLC